NQSIVEQMLDDRAVDRIQLMNDGWWIGATGEIELEKRVQAIAPFVEKIDSFNLGQQRDVVDVDIEVGSYQLVGQLVHHHERGALLYRFGRMKGSDLLKGWLYHLIANRLEAVETTVVTQDRVLHFLPEMCDSKSLERWLALYSSGQSEPSELFVEPAYAYLKQLSVKSNKSPLAAARSKLHDQLSQDYNSELMTLYRGVDDIDGLISEKFELLCQELLVPIWSQLL
ncbi:MAG: hypothetical protein OQK25_01035, partial [Gammaproteobacteria bacterium]|nr:hypothetical protein [Gammaproteobacteria bacterium]